jgi:LysM repeat protein
LLSGLIILALGGLAQPASAQGPCGDIVTVVLGDTLTRIAARCETTVEALLEANPEIENRNLIYVGQVIDIPDDGEPEPAPTPAPTPATYVVEPGDTLTRIADRYNTTVEALLTANPEIGNRNLIYAGQVIEIPGEGLQQTTPYLVKPGETLTGIAAEFDTTAEAILDANPHLEDRDEIESGMVLDIPVVDEGPVVRISPVSGPPGTTIRIQAARFPAETTVEVGAGVYASEFVIVADAQTDADGALMLNMVIPESADPGDSWVVVVRIPGTEIRDTSNVFRVSEAGAVGRVNIYLVAVGDGGQRGREIGCGDSLVPVGVAIAPTRAPLSAALRRLLAIEDETYGQTGLYNSLYRSNLTLQSVVISNRTAIIRLSGDVQIGGVCDEPRFEQQIVATATQFSTVDAAQVFINGQPLEDVL